MGLFRFRREEPIEQLSTEALCARLGLPAQPPRGKPELPPGQGHDYLRFDGPRPAQSRTWREGNLSPR